MSLLATHMQKPLMGKTVQRGPPIPANSIILCRMCKIPVYYTSYDFSKMGIFTASFKKSIGRLCPIAGGPVYRYTKRHLCPECFHEVFAYSTPAIFFVPFPGTLSLMQALHSIWRT